MIPLWSHSTNALYPYLWGYVLFQWRWTLERNHLLIHTQHVVHWYVVELLFQVIQQWPYFEQSVKIIISGDAIWELSLKWINFLICSNLSRVIVLVTSEGPSSCDQYSLERGKDIIDIFSTTPRNLASFKHVSCSGLAGLNRTAYKFDWLTICCIKTDQKTSDNTLGVGVFGVFLQYW